VITSASTVKSVVVLAGAATSHVHDVGDMSSQRGTLFRAAYVTLLGAFVAVYIGRTNVPIFLRTYYLLTKVKNKL